MVSHLGQTTPTPWNSLGINTPKINISKHCRRVQVVSTHRGRSGPRQRRGLKGLYYPVGLLFCQAVAVGSALSVGGAVAALFGYGCSFHLNNLLSPFVANQT